jgi:YesN/AraC family two-component response regulator
MVILKIKNMVCDRCIMTVRRELQDLGCEVKDVSLGTAILADLPDEMSIDAIEKALQRQGFELIRESKKVVIEEIKTELIAYLKLLEENSDPPKLSKFLANSLHRNYSYLSNLFSEQEETTIEQYFIRLKIERVKELLSYEEMTLSQIAWKLNYSSVQYLSNQFKKITGSTVSSYRKQLSDGGRQPLDTVTT